MSEKVKVEVTEGSQFKHEGDKYTEGDTLEMVRKKAEAAEEKGMVDIVEEDEGEEEDEVEELEFDDVSMSENQENKIEKLQDRLGLDDAEIDSLAEDMAGVDSYKGLTGDQAGDLIDNLTKKVATREEAASEVHSWPSGEQGQEAAQKMVEKDKEQIVKEVTGEISKGAIDTWFYQFEQGGETVTGITYDGVMAIFREQGNIDIIIEDIWEEDDNIFVRVRAVDKARNNSIERVSKEPKNRRFAMRIAQSTAQKKAVRALVPDEAITEMYAQWQNNNE